MEQPEEPKPIRWIVAQEGSRQTYAVPLSFHRLGQLRLMYTDIWCRWGRDLLRRGPKGARALATRFEPHIPPELVVSFNPGAILDRAVYHFRRHRLDPQGHAEEYIRFGRCFAKRVRNHLAGIDLDPGRDVFFGFNTNCLETLEFLRARGVPTVVDQVDPGKIEEDLVIEESALWPGWEKAPGRLPEAYWERLRAEWNTADAVLVNSEWSRDALVRQGVPAARIMVVPLAIDRHEARSAQPLNPRGTLRVIWLGSLILRKGIQYLVEAARLLLQENIEFLLAGPVGISEAALRTFPSNTKVLGRITRDQLDKVYRQGHVFVLPTLSDGFAITQLEAMARGLPVVATPNCGRVVTDGVDGLMVPARDSAALAAALSRLDADRQLLAEMSRNALETVSRYDLPSNALMINKEVRQRRGA